MYLQTNLIISNSNHSFNTNHLNHFSNFCHSLKLLQKTVNQSFQFKNIKNNLQFNQVHLQNEKNLECFKEDQGILQHLYKRALQQKKNKISNSKCNLMLNRSTVTEFKVTEKCQEQKCFILFGFSINLLQIETFHSTYPFLSLNIKFYKYSDNDYFRQIEICSLEQESKQDNPQKYKRIVEELEGEELIDCEEISFVLTYQNQKKKKNYIYFFPNINALKSLEEKKDQKAQLTLATFNSNANQKIFNDVEKQSRPYQTMTSLRKSHQNFRILQVLEYYLKLQCHSEHIMITPNQTKLIRQFLGLIYENQIKQFYIFIDHERKNSKTAKSTNRSIMESKKKDYVVSNEPKNHSFYLQHLQHQKPGNSPLMLSNVYISDLQSDEDFISINGQFIINDEFLSKLSELKLPEYWLDSSEFRQQKKLMYQMKLEEYTQSKEIKKMKNTFTDTINYLNSLIGVQKVTYQQISIQSLKLIKNAKIRQTTQEVKQLYNIWKQKEIKNQLLKEKIKNYQQKRISKNLDYQNNLSGLRKDIITIQKKLNLHKNQLSNIYDMQFAQKIYNKNKKNNRFDHKNFNISQDIIYKNQNSYYQTPKTEVNPNKNPQIINSDHILKSTAFKPTSIKKIVPERLKSAQTRIYAQNKKPITIFNKTIQDQFQKLQKVKNNNFFNTKLPQSFSKQVFLNQLNLRKQSFMMNRKSSLLLTKYSSIIQKIRKRNYEQSLKKEMTKCQFQAQKQFQNYKTQYKKAIKELKQTLNDCD